MNWAAQSASAANLAPIRSAIKPWSATRCVGLGDSWCEQRSILMSGIAINHTIVSIDHGSCTWQKIRSKLRHQKWPQSKLMMDPAVNDPPPSSHPKHAVWSIPVANAGSNTGLSTFDWESMWISLGLKIPVPNTRQHLSYFHACWARTQTGKWRASLALMVPARWVSVSGLRLGSMPWSRLMVNNH